MDGGDGAAGDATDAGSVAAALAARPSTLWVVAFLSYGIGDTATTALGFDTPHVAEAGPVISGFVGHAGMGGLFAVKGLSFAGFYLAWRVLPSPGRAGIPLALSVVGILVTAWNVFVLLPPGTF